MFEGNESGLKEVFGWIEHLESKHPKKDGVREQLEYPWENPADDTVHHPAGDLSAGKLFPGKGPEVFGRMLGVAGSVAKNFHQLF